MRIEERCELLQARVAELNIVLGGPDAVTSKWLPVRRRQACGSEAEAAAS